MSGEVEPQPDTWCGLRELYDPGVSSLRNGVPEFITHIISDWLQAGDWGWAYTRDVTRWVSQIQVALAHVGAGLGNGATVSHQQSTLAAAEKWVLRPAKVCWAWDQQNFLHRENGML